MDMPDVAAEFDVSIDIIHLTISVFVFGECCLAEALPLPPLPYPDTDTNWSCSLPGFGLGPLLFAPLSEMVGYVFFFSLYPVALSVSRSCGVFYPDVARSSSSRWRSTSSSPSHPPSPRTLPPLSSVEPSLVWPHRHP